MDLLIAHVSDIHVGKVNFLPEMLEACIKEVNERDPDLLVLSGDLTGFGFKEEFSLAREYIDQFRQEKFIIPGNHDARYRGDIYFEKHFGHGNNVREFSEELTLIGLDSTIPDLDEGNLGRGKQRWLKDKLADIPEDSLKVVVLHHHLVPVPMTGRERAVLNDAGDVLKILVEEGVDLTLSGHRHTPYSWFINNIAVVTAGSPSTEKVRATIPQSYNLVRITDKWIEVRVKEIKGEERLMSKYRRTKGRLEFRLKELECKDVI
ncbi:MAG: metallophosphoesterase [Candidatus Altiarchaeota archaeon]|nr:metallophosphoesterase [Candidatus Altiarchaeota archaeon]